MSKPSGDPKSQHTVQRSLLLGFAGTNSYLQYRNRTGEDRRISCKKASAEDHFYTFYDDDGTRRLDVDDGMRKRVEDAFPALRTAVQTDTLTVRSRKDLNLYVALSLMRTRTFRDLLRQAQRITGPYARRQEMAYRYGRDLRTLSPTARDTLEQAALTMERRVPRHPREARVRDLRTFVDQTDIAYKRLQVLKWHHHEFEQPLLITSDAGVGVLRPDPDPGGVLPHRGIAFLPLSPTSLAVAATKKQHQMLETITDLATVSNQALSDAAYQETFRHPGMPWPTDVQLGVDGPRLNIRLVRPRPGKQIQVDATAALVSHYARTGMHPFLRDLMDRLNETLPLDPSDPSD